MLTDCGSAGVLAAYAGSTETRRSDKRQQLQLFVWQSQLREVTVQNADWQLLTAHRCRQQIDPTALSRDLQPRRQIAGDRQNTSRDLFCEWRLNRTAVNAAAADTVGGTFLQ